MAASPPGTSSRPRGSIVTRLLLAFLVVSVLPTATFALLAIQEGMPGGTAEVEGGGEAGGRGGEAGEDGGEAGGVAEGEAGEQLLGVPIATIELVVAGSTLALGILMALYVGRTIVRPIRELERGMQRVEAGDLETRVGMPSNDEIGRLGMAFDRMVVGLRREALIRDLFGQYVTPELARLAIEQEGHLEGQVVECSILFADIRGFTSLAESLPAHRLLDTLNRYLARMLQEVSAEGGIVNKFGGDSILAIFGSPLNPAADHAARAVRCALRMRDALGAFNQAQAAAGLPEIRAGFGVATGEVIAGNVGSERKVEYTVIGDAVNLAARLQELSRDLGEPILVAGPTAERARDSVVLEPAGVHDIRGRSGRVEVFAARAARGSGG